MPNDVRTRRTERARRLSNNRADSARFRGEPTLGADDLRKTMEFRQRGNPSPQSLRSTNEFTPQGDTESVGVSPLDAAERPTVKNQDTLAARGQRPANYDPQTGRWSGAGLRQYGNDVVVGSASTPGGRVDTFTNLSENGTPMRAQSNLRTSGDGIDLSVEPSAAALERRQTMSRAANRPQQDLDELRRRSAEKEINQRFDSILRRNGSDWASRHGASIEQQRQRALASLRDDANNANRDQLQADTSRLQSNNALRREMADIEAAQRGDFADRTDRMIALAEQDLAERESAESLRPDELTLTDRVEQTAQMVDAIYPNISEEQRGEVISNMLRNADTVDGTDPFMQDPRIAARNIAGSADNALTGARWAGIADRPITSASQLRSPDQFRLGDAGARSVRDLDADALGDWAETRGLPSTLANIGEWVGRNVTPIGGMVNAFTDDQFTPSADERVVDTGEGYYTKEEFLEAGGTEREWEDTFRQIRARNLRDN